MADLIVLGQNGVVATTVSAIDCTITLDGQTTEGTGTPAGAPDDANQIAFNYDQAANILYVWSPTAVAWEPVQGVVEITQGTGVPVADPGLDAAVYYDLTVPTAPVLYVWDDLNTLWRLADSSQSHIQFNNEAGNMYTPTPIVPLNPPAGIPQEFYLIERYDNALAYWSTTDGGGNWNVVWADIVCCVETHALIPNGAFADPDAPTTAEAQTYINGLAAVPASGSLFYFNTLSGTGTAAEPDYVWAVDDGPTLVRIYDPASGGDGNGIYDGGGAIGAATTVTLGTNDLNFDTGGGGNMTIVGDFFVTGKLDVGGLIDPPTGLELDPQVSNPGGVAQNTIWIDSADGHVRFGDVDLHLLPTIYATAAIVVGSTLDINSPDLLAVGDWIVVDPYTVNAEVRKVTGIASNTITVNVPFTNAHTINTMVAQIESPVWKATHFGVVADDTTDDLFAWDALMADIALQGGGIILNDFDGTSRVSSEILMTQGSIVWAGTRKSVLRQTDTSTAARLILVQAAGITFDGWFAHGNYSTGDVSNLRYIIELSSFSSDITITDMEFTEARNHAIRINGAKGVHVDRCLFYTLGDETLGSGTGDGVYITKGGVTPGSFVVVTNNTFRDMGRSPVVIINGNDIIVAKNTCEGSSNSVFDIEANVAGEEVRRVVIAQNVSVNDGSRAEIGFGVTAAVAGEVSDIAIVGNTFDVNEYFGTITRANNVVVGNNVFRGRSKAGTGHMLKVNFCVDVTTKGNTFVDESPLATVDMLVYEDMSGGIISGNAFRNAGRSAIACQSDGCDISTNEINGSGGEGAISIVDSDISVTNNKIRGATQHGIQVNGSDCEVVGNKIFSPTLSGIRVTPNGDESRIEGNRVSSPGAQGIRVDTGAGGVTLDGNRVYSAGADGILLQSSVDDCDIRKNKVVGSAGSGISMTTATRVSVDQNRLIDNTGFGIDFDAVGGSVLGNYAYDDGSTNQTHGLNISATTNNVRISDNDLSGNVTAALSGSTPLNYRPNPNGTFATDMANFNIL